MISHDFFNEFWTDVFFWWNSSIIKMSANDCKLNSSKDWKDWNQQFKLMTVAADLWNIVQELKVSIQKSAESNINIYSHSAAALQTCSQSQADNQAAAAEDSQLTVQQDSQQKSVKFVQLIIADQKFYSTALIIYKNKLKVYKSE